MMSAAVAKLHPEFCSRRSARPYLHSYLLSILLPLEYSVAIINRNMLTHERLKQLLSYDPLSGQFSWITTCVGRFKRVKKGKIAGHILPNGYVSIGVDGEQYLAHRLAFFFVNGIWPPHQMDHIDHVRNNNKWENLRAVSSRQNAQNRSLRSDNKSGKSGVHWTNNRWRSCIWHEGKSIYLGNFDSKEAAIDARLSAERKYFTHSAT